MSGIKITKALYGSGSTTVDVTKSVMSHMRDGAINLVVTPDALNVPDPAPGQQKTLDVSYVINNGKQMNQSIKDNELLMISAPPERLATGLQITKAEYGYAGNWTDVTDAIQNHVRDGTIKITVGPKSAGIPDPNPNKQKSLAVEYTVNGSPNTVELVDGKTLNISAPPLDSADPTTPSGYVKQLVGIVFSNIFVFLGMLLYTISMFTTADFFDAIPIYNNGSPVEGSTPKSFLETIKEPFSTSQNRSRLVFLGMGAIPGIAYWGLPVYVFWRRIFSNSYTI